MLSFFQFLEASYNAATHSAFGTAVNLSVWLFATIQAVHLVTLAIVGCAILVVDLRLVGWGLRNQPVARVAAEAHPWLIWGLIGQIATGLPMFISLAATKYYGHPTFWLKMYLLTAALLFTFTVRRHVALRADTRANSGVARAVGIVSILLWSGICIMAKGIAYY